MSENSEIPDKYKDLPSEEKGLRKMEAKTLDFSPSSGSIGNAYHAGGPTRDDGRQKTATKFRPDETSNTSIRWENLDELQEGQHENDTKNRAVMMEQRDDLKLFSETAKLTSWEKKYAMCLLKALQEKQQEQNNNNEITKETDAPKGYDFENPEKYERDNKSEKDTDSETGSFYGRSESFLLAIITYAANKNDRRIRQKNRFKELQDNLNVTKNSVRNQRERIREYM